MHTGLLRIAALAVLLSSSFTLFSQHYCGQAILENERREADPTFDALVRYNDSLLFTQAQHMSSADRAETHIIPVVFHVIHLNGDENINDDQIHDAIRIMNEDFNAENAELDDIVSSFQNRIGDAEIEFRLATIDPDGNFTTGIDRIESAQTNVGTESSKLNIWNRNNYYNIWVTNVIGLGGASAYAIRPSNNPSASRDGVISNHRYVGSIGTSSYSGSKTLSHESAHYLNVIHTWGESNTPGLSTNCSMDDFVLDTPNTQGTGNGSCNLTQNTCNSLDNVQNFMDYASCESMFTEGQVNVMRSALTAYSIRNNLWTEDNLEATGASGLHEARYFVEKSVACRSEAVQFFDESRYDATSWEWELSGPVVLTSSEQHPVFTFDVPGVYDVKLTVSNGSVTKTIEDAAAFSVADVYGAGMPFEEDFVEPHPGWAQDENEHYNGKYWKHTDAVGQDDNASYMLENLFEESHNNRDLIFNSLDFRGMTRVELSYDLAFRKISSSNNDELLVQFSNDCGETWRTLDILSAEDMSGGRPTTSSAFTPENSSDWESFSNNNIPLTWLGSNTMLRFKFITGGGNNVYIDNVNIDGDFEDVPYLVYPDNGAMNTANDVVVDWRSVPGASAYELQISTESNFGSTVESLSIPSTGDASNNDDTQYKSALLENGQQYYWRVRADGGAWSETWNFTVAEDGVGTQELISTDEMVLFPNPTNDVLNIQLPQAVENASLEVYNVSGQLIDRSSITSNKRVQEVTTSHFAEGVYFLQVRTNETTWRSRFVINR